MDNTTRGQIQFQATHPPITYPTASSPTPQSRGSSGGVEALTVPMLVCILGYVALDWALGWDLAEWPLRGMMLPIALTEKWDFLAGILLEGTWSIGMLLTQVTLFVPLKIGWGLPVIGGLFLLLALGLVNPRRNVFTIPVALIAFACLFGHFFGLFYARSAAAELDERCPVLVEAGIDPSAVGACDLDEESRGRIANKLRKSALIGRDLADTRYEVGRYLVATGHPEAARKAFLSVPGGVLAEDTEDQARQWLAILDGDRSPGGRVADLDSR